MAPIWLAFPDHPGIHEQLPSVRKLNGAARETAVPVINLIRSQRGRKVFPVQQVLAHRMPPVHGSPIGVIRIVLVKHMVFPLIPGKTVGIIHPSGACGQMERRPFLFGYHLLESLLVLARFPQCLACHHILHTPVLYFAKDGHPVTLLQRAERPPRLT